MRPFRPMKQNAPAARTRTVRRRHTTTTNNNTDTTTDSSIAKIAMVRIVMVIVRSIPSLISFYVRLFIQMGGDL